MTAINIPYGLTSEGVKDYLTKLTHKYDVLTIEDVSARPARLYGEDELYRTVVSYLRRLSPNMHFVAYPKYVHFNGFGSSPQKNRWEDQLEEVVEELVWCLDLECTTYTERERYSELLRALHTLVTTFHIAYMESAATYLLEVYDTFNTKGAETAAPMLKSKIGTYSNPEMLAMVMGELRNHDYTNLLSVTTQLVYVVGRELQKSNY